MKNFRTFLTICISSLALFTLSSCDDIEKAKNELKDEAVQMREKADSLKEEAIKVKEKAEEIAVDVKEAGDNAVSYTHLTLPTIA